MTWTKLSDDFTDDTWTLSDAAARMHVDGLVWSNRKLLDLHIPKVDLPRFAKTPSAVTELLEGGWWHEDDEHYVIDHHARYQRLREAVIKQQTVNKENRAKRGQGTPAAREVRFNDSSNDSSIDSSNHSSDGHDSSNEMDRTGRDEKALGVAFDEKTGEVEAENNSTPRTTSSWAVAPIPQGKACPVCLAPLEADYPAAVCPKQDEAHTAARRSVA
jgi:hypothetical protein